MGATAEIAKFVRDVRPEDLPKEAIRKAKEMFYDTIGVLLSGTLESSGRIATKFAKEQGGNAEASVFPDGFRTSASMAAFINGLLAHNQDFDDWIPKGTEEENWPRNAGHVSCVIVPSALALGEKLGASGMSVILAYVIGVEVYNKIAGACGDARARGWHSMAIYGPIGAAAASAKLLNLNEHQIAMAIGIATSAAGGLYFGNTRTFTNAFHSGHAARSGVEASLLVREGFTSNSSMLEFSMGFCDSFLGEGGCDYNKMTRDLGNPFHIVYPGLGIKPYPCAWPTFSTLEGILGLKKEYNIAYEDVDRVEVWVSPHQDKRFNIPEPTSAYHAKFSYNFVGASALLDGRVVRDTFKDEKLKDVKVKEAMGKIKIIVDEKRANESGLSHATVVIRLKNSKEYRKLALVPRGHPKNPLSHNEILAKYRGNVESVLPQDKVQQSINLIEDLENTPNIRELMNALQARVAD